MLTIFSETRLQLSDSHQPPNQREERNFREISILPTIEELLDEKRPNLTANITEGTYVNVDHYLDVHFRLAREDYIAPLRDGIQYYRTYGKSKTSKYPDMWVHEEVKIGNAKYNRQGVIYELLFNNKHFTTVEWDQSKRFMHGSLLCLSNDNFKTILSAVVADSNPKDLKKGIVVVKFQDDSQTKSSKVYSVAELPTFFDGYRPVLEGLQSFNDENLPLQKYIIDAQKRLDPPAYLNHSSRYKFVVGTQETSLMTARVLDINDWPPEEKLNLDDSQREAMHLALASELAIIQGPPGTGKTHVALKIIQTLLENQDVWQGKAKIGPILVVSMTNHALDQFLERVLRFNKAIIRVGIGSESEKLKEYTLMALQERLKLDGNSGIHSARIKNIGWQLAMLKKSIEAQMKLIQDFISGRISEEDVVKYMPESLQWGYKHLFESNSVQKVDRGLLLKTWLGLTLDSVFVSNKELGSFLHDGRCEVDKVCRKIKAVLGLKRLTLKEAVDPHRSVQDIGDRIEITFSRVPGASDFQRICRTVDVECLDVDRQYYKPKMGQLLVQSRHLRISIVQNVQSDVMTDEEVGDVRNVWSLALKDRWRLYLKCRNDLMERWSARTLECLKDMQSEIAKLQAEYERKAKRLREMSIKERCSLLKQCDVIGMTTTGAAKNLDVLSVIQPKIVVVEEAARVFESHIICALTSNTQQLILIGDHKQLRAQVNVHRLSEECHLDISLFERLINNDIRYATLQVQHRMRPEISGLLVPFIYQNLRNHPDVLKYPQIKGTKSNMFFLKHNAMEDKMDDDAVHANTFEAKYLLALCRYLLQQSYQTSQITIITAYNGQLNALQKRMKDANFNGVRVTSIDGFQGEESDIVLLSFVRSNAQKQIGFLKFDNRVNVALSRAKMGLYCVGNFDLFAKKSKFWRNVVASLTKDGLVGNEMTLKCQQHGTLTKVATANQFNKFSPDGGCLKQCGQVLDCNHVCKRRCHGDPHSTLCLEPCIKVICNLNHSCPLKCSEKCKPCVQEVFKRCADCGHSEWQLCFVDIRKVKCVNLVKRELQCGHTVDLKCHIDVTSYQCVTRVRRKLPACVHSYEMSCYQDASAISCRLKCGQVLDCSHVCKRLCHKGLHSTLLCEEPCSRVCDLKHPCRLKCFEKCKPCDRQVLKLRPDCGHSEWRACGVDIRMVKCMDLVKRELQCGHSVDLECHVDVTSYPQCVTKVLKKLPACGHSVWQACGVDIRMVKCVNLVRRKLQCGHWVDLKCHIGVSRYPQCAIRILKQLPACGHYSEMCCYEDGRAISCPLRCTHRLKCGHVCPRNCHLLATGNQDHEKIKCSQCRSKCVLS